MREPSANFAGLPSRVMAETASASFNEKRALCAGSPRASTSTAAEPRTALVSVSTRKPSSQRSTAISRADEGSSKPAHARTANTALRWFTTERP